MLVVLAILLAFTFVLALTVGSMAFNFHSSDAAGNGLAVAFILVFTAALYALVAVILIVVTVRAPHGSLPPDVAVWRKFAGGTLLLFVVAAASQLAAIRVLSEPGVPAFYAVPLQLTFFAMPIAFLLYAAWRTYGIAAVSPATVAVVCGSVILAGSLLPWPGLIRLQVMPSPSARAPTVATLRYPAVLIWDRSHLVIIESPDDLATMHTNRVLHRVDDPVLVDSNHRAFTLTGLKFRGSSLKLMVTGPGRYPVEFTLARVDLPVKSQTTRDLILGCKELDADAERDAEIRRRITQRELLENMIEDLRITD